MTPQQEQEVNQLARFIVEVEQLANLYVKIYIDHEGELRSGRQTVKVAYLEGKRCEKIRLPEVIVQGSWKKEEQIEIDLGLPELKQALKKFSDNLKSRASVKATEIFQSGGGKV